MCELATVSDGAPEAGLITVGSLAVSLDVLVSAPPETLTELVTLAGAVVDTLTTSVITGKTPLAGSTVVVVQFNAKILHDQPEPLSAVAVSPAGKLFTTVTVPLVAAVPELITVML
jgi:hypothetical protein